MACRNRLGEKRPLLGDAVRRKQRGRRASREFGPEGPFPGPLELNRDGVATEMRKYGDGSMLDRKEQATMRKCGDCQLCCRLVPVPTIKKPANVRCAHQSLARGAGYMIAGRSPAALILVAGCSGTIPPICGVRIDLITSLIRCRNSSEQSAQTASKRGFLPFRFGVIQDTR